MKAELEHENAMSLVRRREAVEMTVQKQERERIRAGAGEGGFERVAVDDVGVQLDDSGGELGKEGKDGKEGRVNEKVAQVKQEAAGDSDGMAL